MSTPHDTRTSTEGGTPPAHAHADGDARHRLTALASAAAAVMEAVAEELERPTPPPASQFAHALWIGGLVGVLAVAGSRGIGADAPLVSLAIILVTGLLIFSRHWFDGQAARRAHVQGRKEMSRAVAKQLGEARVADARAHLEGSGGSEGGELGGRGAAAGS
jgi:hypothetical protein